MEAKKALLNQLIFFEESKWFFSPNFASRSFIDLINLAESCDSSMNAAKHELATINRINTSSPLNELDIRQV